jgi:hypothetical protein
MKIQRPDCTKTLRQGSVSIPLLGSTFVPVLAPSVGVVWWPPSATRIPSAGHEGTVAITESDRISGHCTAGQLQIDPVGPGHTSRLAGKAPTSPVIFDSGPLPTSGRSLSIAGPPRDRAHSLPSAVVYLLSDSSLVTVGR